MNKNTSLLLIIVGAVAAAYFFIFNKQPAMKASTSGLQSAGVPKVAQSTNNLRSSPIQSGAAASRTQNALAIAAASAAAIGSLFGKGSGSGSGGGFNSGGATRSSSSGNNSSTSGVAGGQPSTYIGSGVPYNPSNDSVTSTQLDTGSIPGNEQISLNDGIPISSSDTVTSADIGSFDATQTDGSEAGVEDFSNFGG